MRRILQVLGLCGVLVATSPTFAQTYKVVKLADGIYDAIGQNGGLANAQFIVGPDNVIAIDTSYRPSWTKDEIAEIRRLPTSRSSMSFTRIGTSIISAEARPSLRLTQMFSSLARISNTKTSEKSNSLG